jgi:hypothetical protein
MQLRSLSVVATLRLVLLEILGPLMIPLGAHMAVLVVVELEDGVHVLWVIRDVGGVDDHGATEPHPLHSDLLGGAVHEEGSAALAHVAVCLNERLSSRTGLRILGEVSVGRGISLLL